MRTRTIRRNKAKIDWRRKNKINKNKLSFTDFWRKNITKY